MERFEESLLLLSHAAGLLPVGFAHLGRGTSKRKYAAAASAPLKRLSRLCNQPMGGC